MRRHVSVGMVVVLAVGLLLGMGAGWAQARWYTYEACRLIEHPYNDGDSFHVRTKSDERIFRLYFVDAPETDDSIEGRLIEQADYWGLNREQALQLGEQAKAFSADFLKNGFVAYSKREDARGRSDQQRHFAMIRVGDLYLSQALVSNGLARVYGKYTDLPDGKSSWKFVADLRVLERAAQTAKRGAWGMGIQSGATPPEAAVFEPRGTVELAARLAVYSLEPRPRLLGFLEPKAKVTLLGAQRLGWERIRFKTEAGEREAQCRRSALDGAAAPDEE